MDQLQQTTPGEPIAEPTTLYRFFDVGDQLLYVGITSNPVTRWDNHSRTKRNWQQAVRATLEHFGTREEALAAEAVAIRTERPLWNIQHNVRPQADPQLRAAAERRLDEGQWLRETELADLFGASLGSVDRWLRIGPPLTKRPIGHRPSVGGEREACPEDVAALLSETRKWRDADHPDGIPGQVSAPPTE